ncbi:hypothetical protein BOSEA31B_14839 [Hyphomicrobiales bacterium]|nr:hypothetical protein BOSEA31B_14839 [Hyphomicrobiales bacterium]CAH1701329.1 hypothetical protein BOSEA1005_21028 [Hyphomicrobiales bacterium]
MAARQPRLVEHTRIHRHSSRPPTHGVKMCHALPAGSNPRPENLSTVRDRAQTGTLVPI